MKKLNNIVLFTCNEGGHFSQMMALKELFGDYPSVLLTDNSRASKDLKGLERLQDVIVVGGTATTRIEKKGAKHADSRWTYFWGYVALFKECRQALKKVRPRVIVTTGSNIAVPTFIYGKMMGCKLIFIESRAHVYGKTLTGKLIARLSDKVIVQWPEMLKIYPQASYYGVLV